MYTLRSDKGVMIAEISNKNASHIITNADGEWVSKNFQKGTRCVFQMKDDGVLSVGLDTTVFLWKGYYISQE